MAKKHQEPQTQTAPSEPTSEPQTAHTTVNEAPTVADLIGAADPDAPITFAVTAGLDSMNHQELKDLFSDAENENTKFDFARKLLAVRMEGEKLDAPRPPMAVPPAIAEQTRLEMEAGRAAVAKHAADRLNRPRPQPEEQPGTVSVFRPEDYVPDQRKGQGHVGARPV